MLQRPKCGAERRGGHSHAERGNERREAWKRAGSGELAGYFGPAERFNLVGLVEEIFFQVRFNF